MRMGKKEWSGAWNKVQKSLAGLRFFLLDSRYDDGKSVKGQEYRDKMFKKAGSLMGCGQGTSDGIF